MKIKRFEQGFLGKSKKELFLNKRSCLLHKKANLLLRNEAEAFLRLAWPSAIIVKEILTKKIS